MLFHLFIFFSHMNWFIPSHSAGKLSIRMIHVHIVIDIDIVLHPLSYSPLPSCPFSFVSHYPPYFILLCFTTPLLHVIIMSLYWQTSPICNRTAVYSEHGHLCVINSSLASHFFPSHFISFFFPFSFLLFHSSFLSFVLVFVCVYDVAVY